jgi:dTDP-4-dehydrorhamnose 3,5-epimerase
MKIIPTPISGLIIIEPSVFRDERGFFLETWNQETWAQVVGPSGTPYAFLQDNHSRSARGVLRGLHFQRPPHEQGKLVSVTRGRALDVAVDLRTASPTYGQHFSLELNGTSGADNPRRALWIPPGFAHGFLALEDETDFVYKCTAGYAPGKEGALPWDDAKLAIDWGLKEEGISVPNVSAKDAAAESFESFESPF